MLRSVQGSVARRAVRPQLRALRSFAVGSGSGAVARGHRRSVLPLYTSHSHDRSAAAPWAADRTLSSSTALFAQSMVAAEVCAAVAKGDLEAVQRIVEADPTAAAAKDYEGRTALHVACILGEYAIAQHLVACDGVDVNQLDLRGRTPLADAIDGGNRSLVKFLAKSGAQLQLPEDALAARLCDAAADGDVARLQLLIDAGADVNTGDYDKRCALHLAAAEGNAAVVKQLIDHPTCDIDVRDRWGRTPLDEALMHERGQVVTMLRSKGAQASREGEVTQVTQLLDAAAAGDLDAVERQVNGGIDVNAVDYDKRSALHLACAEGHFNVVRYLLDNQADLNSVDRFERTPLDDAMRGGFTTLVHHLRSRGASSAKDTAEMAPDLIEAAARGDCDEIEKLVSVGADVNVGDYDQRTPLHLAVSNGHLDAVRLLVRLSADVNALDRFGNSPYEDARRLQTASADEICELLLASGAVPHADVWKRRLTPEFDSSISSSLYMLADRGQFEYAEAWVPGEREQGLVCSKSFYSAPEIERTVGALRDERFTGGELSDEANVVVKVWQSGTPEWFEDLRSVTFGAERDASFKAAGLRSGVVVPLIVNQNTLAVLVFMDTEHREKDSTIIDQYRDVAVGLIASGMSGALVGSEFRMQHHAGHGEAEDPAITELMNVVYARCVSRGVFSTNVVYEEVDWFFNHLRFDSFYFHRFSAEQIASHVQLYIAAKKVAQASNRPEEIALEAPTPTGTVYILTAQNEAIDATEAKIEEQIAALGDDEAYSVASFCSQGMPVPGGHNKLEVYIFDKCKFANPSPPPDSTDIYTLATESFLASKTEHVLEKYGEELQNLHGKLAPSLRITRVEARQRDGRVVQQHHLMFSFRTGSSYLSMLTGMMERLKLRSERKFIETFSNGVVSYSIYLQPPRDQSEAALEAEQRAARTVLRQVSLLHTLPRSQLTPLFLNRTFDAEEYAYATAVSRCIYYFLNRKSDEYQALAAAFHDDPVNLSRLENLHTQLRTAAVPPQRIMDCMINNVGLIKEMYADFEVSSRDGRAPRLNEELLKKALRTANHERDVEILRAFAEFNAHVLKTNFNVQRKSALSFRLDGQFAGLADFPEAPYALFYVQGPDFQGFHVRFRDVSRGGIRLIPFHNMHAYSKNAETQFSETYDLAYTQNKKNKDIPEFGSKGTILLYPHAPTHAAGKFLAFQKYVSGLLDLLVVEKRKASGELHDHYGQEELLFLGPDEGTADWMEWAALYARQRGYKYWKAFTTGKPPSLGGVPHDTYAMTTRSVHRFKLGALRKLGLDEAAVTKFQTGGPDGDLGSNEILISKDSTKAIVDGSGVLYDPNGLDRAALEELAHRRQMVEHFPASKLSPGGFFVATTERDVTLPSGEFVESGLAFRNTFHLHELAEADLFVPCGGRPESVNVSNVHKLLRKDGSPKFAVIVEGANLFFTQDARLVLEQAGAVLIKDASANKGGVTSSSLEVLAALSLTDQEFAEHMAVGESGDVPAFYQRYVQGIQHTLEQNADLEFEALWSEKLATGTPMHVITDQLSNKINQLNDFLSTSDLFDDAAVLRAVLAHAVPHELQELVGLERIIERVPDAYLRAMFSCYLASRYIYQYGIHASELAFFSFMKQFNVGKQHTPAAAAAKKKTAAPKKRKTKKE